MRPAASRIHVDGMGDIAGASAFVGNLYAPTELPPDPGAVVSSAVTRLG